MKNESREVEAFSAKVRNPERKMEKPLFRLPKMLIDIEDKMVHVVRRLVAVVEEMERAFLSAVEILVKARKFPLILNIVHALSVRAFSDHREMSACNLPEKIVDIAAVLLAENHGRADYCKAVRPVTYGSQKKFSVLNLYIPMLKYNIFYFFFIIYIIKS